MILDRRSLVRGLMGSTAAAATLPLARRSALAAIELRYGLEPRQAAPGIWLFEGRTEYFSVRNGGNIVNTCFVDTGEGLVVFDTGPCRIYGEEMRAAIRRASPMPVRQVVLSHAHPDHYLGNQAFTDVPIMAGPATRAMLQELAGPFADNMYRLIDVWMRGTETVPPTEDLAAGLLPFGRRRLEVLLLAGHTRQDAALFDHDTGTLIAGDLVFWNRAPTTPSADIPSWLRSLDRLEAMAPKRVVPGHGGVSEGVVAIRQTRRYLEWLAATLGEAAEKGLAMAEAMRLPIPAEFQDIAVLPGEYVRSVSHLYPAIEQATLPRIN
ncbi:quinoprotein relay system zinc metallohydrolase 1 [Benzoatithermus flavus]|uniref:Quinoprotein relay system zinc metallohydrolase 1 n=1 Tax=Benzoatithermus flavus TaxID=3108223 RepID=A0ABU8XTG2_9PROT